MITIIIHHSALELISKKNVNIEHKSIINDVIRRKKKTFNEILLDISVHQSAINPDIISNSGRPDIIHQTILTFHHNIKLLESKLSDKINLIIHTKEDLWFSVYNEWRIPVSYIRFRGLIEKLLHIGSIKLDSNTNIEIKNNNLDELILDLKPDKIIDFSINGELNNGTILDSVYGDILLDKHTILLIGGYQKGSVTINESLNQKYSQIKLFEKSTTAWNILGYIMHYFLIKK